MPLLGTFPVQGISETSALRDAQGALQFWWLPKLQPASQPYAGFTHT